MFKNTFYLLFICNSFMFLSCSKPPQTEKSKQYLVVLGTMQDAGYPHINNPKEFAETKYKKQVTSLGLVDHAVGKKWLFEATPDMPFQLNHLESQHLKSPKIIDGIFLTHAHIGHYTGLMYFGREAMGAKQIKVFAMPKLQAFLETNGPWSQLVSLRNISIEPLKAGISFSISNNLTVTPFLVPHRDEFSETVGYKIVGPHKSALFIPDINKWSLWERSLKEELKKVDYAFLDATFLADGEIPRPMSEVPHPFIEETVSLLKNSPLAIKSKIVFIHFNHSNPVLDQDNSRRKELEREGFRFATFGTVFEL
jgi:pyrroloquinoline quinone biosynthesis protein B